MSNRAFPNATGSVCAALVRILRKLPAGIVRPSKSMVWSVVRQIVLTAGARYRKRMLSGGPR